MKKLILTTTFVFAAIVFSFAQKYAYVDTEYILGNIPEYADSQAELDDLSAKWQKEIEAEFNQIDQMYQAYQAEAVLLPEEMKKKREEEIIEAEQAGKKLQRQRFGPDGDLYKKRQELIKPIQEKIYNAIEAVAVEKNYGFVFDKAGGMTMLYVNSKYDISDDVLEKMGYSYGGGN